MQIAIFVLFLGLPQQIINGELKWGLYRGFY